MIFVCFTEKNDGHDKETVIADSQREMQLREELQRKIEYVNDKVFKLLEQQQQQILQQQHQQQAM